MQKQRVLNFGLAVTALLVAVFAIHLAMQAGPVKQLGFDDISDPGTVCRDLDPVDQNHPEIHGQICNWGGRMELASPNK